MSKSKESTARISLFKDLNIPMIYTMEASFCGADQGELEGMHFNSEHFNKVGRNLFHALILKLKIDPYEIVEGKPQILEMKESEENSKINYDDLMEEYEEKEAELLVESDDGSSAGSDSQPSEDNMSDDEISKILPLKVNKKKQKKLPTQNSFKKRNKELELKMREKIKKKKEQERAKKSPMKRISNYKNALKGKFNLSRISKVKMVDNWTQTSNRGSDTENEESKDFSKADEMSLN
mmetsp:Transcript_27276/g.27147  ORF Transcript_27276/g.27147 Transcript_27276/m.27147 type:complete len:237 (+) Transcript_27276:213-923(+)